MKLFFRKYGQGPPLMILHGLYGSSDNWVTIAGKLASSFTVYLPDLRNHGNSPHSDVHDYDAMSNDIIELAGDIGLSKFFLAGHSMGGKVAIEVALKKPGLLSGLLIADILPFSDATGISDSMNEHIAILKAILGTDLSLAKRRDEVDEQLQPSIKQTNVRALIMKNLQRKQDGRFTWKINADALLDNLEKITGSIDMQKINHIPVKGFPVVFLRGEHSQHVSREGFTKVLDQFPRAELKTIPNAGHWLQADNPEAVTAAILGLLNN